MEAPTLPPTPRPIGLKGKNVSEGPGIVFPDALELTAKSA